MTRVPLHDGWTLRAVPDAAGPPDPARTAGVRVPDHVAGVEVPATVPGCVHTDLLAAGLIPDPYLDDNELAVAWIGRTDWEYVTTFDWPGDSGDSGDSGGGSDGSDGSDGSGDAVAERVDLVCAGLDTVATVTLNDVELGRTANMHRGYRFDTRPALRVGPNTLRIRFTSAYRYAEAVRDALGDRPNAYPEPFQFIRKMACNFGWDWGPTLVTAGIWQPIGLHAWSVARLAQVRPQVTVADRTGTVTLYVEIERPTAEPGDPGEPAGGETGAAPLTGATPLTVAASVAGHRAEATVAPGARDATLTLVVPDVERWWPRGHGEPTRYPVEVTLRGADGALLDTWTRRVGFRGVRLDTTPDAHGSAFTVVVNDVPVVVRGVNWIPDDVFVTRVTRERLAHRFDQAIGANVNLLRVWGGGRYESEDFYDLADELGLLVQQDFLFACAAYPEEAPLAAEVAAEAREQVVRLAGHPSLVLWTGNNENIWGWHDWGWRERLGDRTWGAGYYFDLLPAIVAELDPTRPYWPGSPWSGDPLRHPNDPAHGTTHIWDVWNQEDYTRYRAYRPRFVAEFGYQAPPAYATLRRALRDEPLAPDSPGMAHHQKAADGDAKLRRGLDAHLPPPADFDDWHYLTQVNQARAISLGVEHFRSLHPICTGTIVWQLNDCWPVTSWAAIDGDGRRKPLWYALRRAYADRLLTIAPRDGGPALAAVNDSADPWHLPVLVTRLTLAGEPLAKTTIEVAVPARSTLVVPLPVDLATPGDPLAELLRAEPLGASADSPHRALWFFAEDRDMPYPPATYDTEVESVPAGHLMVTRVRVTARTILRDLVLAADRLDPTAEVDDALVTLLPGESVTFTVHSAGPLDPTALTTRPVLRAVNG